MKKTALITGASSGIGKELAKIHASNGDNLVIIARSRDALNALKQELEAAYKIKVWVIVKDLSLPSAAQEVYKQIQQENIQVNYLINNAGFGGVGKFHERNLDDDLAMINLNIKALVSLTHLFLQDFIRANSGSILNVSSSVSLIPAGPMQAVYFATKSFVSSFSNALASELSNTNVTVTNLMPGATETGFGATSGMEGTALFKNPGSARKVAEKGYQSMMEGKLNCIAGVSSLNKLSLKLLPLLPKKLVLKQIKKLQQKPA